MSYYYQCILKFKKKLLLEFKNQDIHDKFKLMLYKCLEYSKVPKIRNLIDNSTINNYFLKRAEHSALIYINYLLNCNYIINNKQKENICISGVSEKTLNEHMLKQLDIQDFYFNLNLCEVLYDNFQASDFFGCFLKKLPYLKIQKIFKNEEKWESEENYLDFVNDTSLELIQRLKEIEENNKKSPPQSGGV